MVLPTITYDATNGSDTAASGAGPSSAVTGTNADGTGGDITIVLNETKDFTGASDDGSDVMWVDTIAGDRHLFSISSFTGGVSTCTAIVVNESIGTGFTAKSWGVGGKRAGFENDTSNRDWKDWSDGWIIELESGATPDTYTVTAEMDIKGGTSATGPTVVRATIAAATQPVINQATATTSIFSSASIGTNKIACLKGLKLTGYRGVEFKTTSNTTIVIRECTIDTSNHGVYVNRATSDCVVIDCDVTSSGGDGIGTISQNNLHLTVIRCRIHDTGGHGIIAANTAWSGSSTVLLDNTVWNAGDVGIRISTQGGNGFLIVRNNSVGDSTNDGFLFVGTLFEARPIVLENNISYGNGAWGYRASGGMVLRLLGPNAYGNNTSGNLSGITAHADDVVLTADPWIDSGATEDLGLNAVAGGGLPLRGTAAGRTS